MAMVVQEAPEVTADMICIFTFKIKLVQHVILDGYSIKCDGKGDKMEKIQMMHLTLQDGTVSHGMKLLVFPETDFMYLTRYY